MIELTIGIPTANRPAKICQCLDSIKDHLKIPYRIIVVDSSESSLALSADYIENMEIIHPPSMVSPSHARKMISDKFDTEYLLYLDDDMSINAGSIELLMNFIKTNEEVDIVGGALNEYGYWRDIGFLFHIGHIDGERTINKSVITKPWLDEMGYESFRVDLITQPPFLMRRSVFKDTSFDPSYKWAKEIYDYFYSCYLENKKSYVLPRAIFNHHPTHYGASTFKHDKKVFNKEGNDTFTNKWGLKILSPKRVSMFKVLIKEYIYRHNKIKMTKQKIRLDEI